MELVRGAKFGMLIMEMSCSIKSIAPGASSIPTRRSATIHEAFAVAWMHMDQYVFLRVLHKAESIKRAEVCLQINMRWT